MTNKKISALASATTPLAGTEVLPIVQSSATTKVSVADLTVGRAVTASSFAAVGDTSGATLTATGSAAVNLGRATIQNTDASGKKWVLGDGVGVANGTFALYNLTDFVPVIGAVSTGDVKIITGNLVQGTAAKGINFTANTGAAGMTSRLLNWYEEGVWTPVATSSVGSITTYVATGVYTRVGRIVFLQAAISVTAAGTASGNMNISGIPFTANRLTSSISYESNATGFSSEFQIAAGGTTGVVLSFTNTGITWSSGMIQNLSFTITV